MSKFHAPVVSSNTDRPLDRCHSCGWCFAVDNKKKVLYDEDNPTRWRLQPRTQINTGRTVWCDTCYEKSLIARGEHTKSGGPAESLYRDALNPQRAKLSDAEKKANRERLDVAMKDLMSRIRKSPDVQP